MKNKYFFIFLLILGIGRVPGKTGQFYTTPPSDRIKTNIDFGWLFINRDFPAEEETHQVNDLVWEKVDLPHDWTIGGQYARDNNIKVYDINSGIGTHIAIDEGLIFPGGTFVSTDSHANIMGAIGALGQGMGDQDIAAAWANGKIWFLWRCLNLLSIGLVNK